VSTTSSLHASCEVVGKHRRRSSIFGLSVSRLKPAMRSPAFEAPSRPIEAHAFASGRQLHSEEAGTAAYRILLFCFCRYSKSRKIGDSLAVRGNQAVSGEQVFVRHAIDCGRPCHWRRPTPRQFQRRLPRSNSQGCASGWRSTTALGYLNNQL